MSDLLQSGVTWLRDQLRDYVSRQVTYSRGAQTLSVNATLGRKVLRVVDGEGHTRIEVTDSDFIINSAALVINAVKVEPQRGDRITVTIDRDYLHEILPYGDEPVFRYCDPGRQMLRIHGKGIAFPPPAPASVTPGSGNTSTPTPVTISGSNFQTMGTTTVTVGGVAATSVVVVNSATITCTFPVGGAGTFDVVVTNPDGQSGTLANGFSRSPPPTVTSVTDPVALAGGGIVVTVSGTNFVTSGTTSVTFGGTAATGVSVSNSTTLTCTVPAHAAGLVNVVVTNPDAQSGTLANGFTYLPAGAVFWIWGDKQTFQDSGFTTAAAADGDPVGGWKDQPDNSPNAAQSNNAMRGTLKTGANGKNGHSIVRTNGSLGWMNLASTVTLNDFTIFVALKPNADSGLFGGATIGQIRVGRSAANVLSVHDGANEAISSALSVVLGNWMLCEYVRSGVGSGNVSFYQNGTAFGTGTVPNALNLTILGAFSGGGANIWNADVLGAIVYPSALSTSDRQIVETFWKNFGNLY